MKFNSEQKEKLINTFIRSGLYIDDFIFSNPSNEIFFYNKVDPTYRFQIRDSIENARFCDVFCRPYTYQDTIYKGCDSFAECIELAGIWATITKYRLRGKPYYHKIFISHSSKDQDIINTFVDRFLRLSCGYESSNIVYTSKQITGVAPGEQIPKFIRNNIQTSDLVIFMISQNYKQSEVCLNEMGVAWALEKQIIPILLPNVSFNDIGWLNSLNKAIKIDDNEGLDRLFAMLQRDNANVMDWNTQKEQFLKDCSKAKQQVYL